MTITTKYDYDNIAVVKQYISYLRKNKDGESQSSKDNSARPLAPDNMESLFLHL